MCGKGRRSCCDTQFIIGIGHRILQSLMLEKTSKFIQSIHQLILTMPTEPHSSQPVELSKQQKHYFHKLFSAFCDRYIKKIIAYFCYKLFNQQKWWRTALGSEIANSSNDPCRFFRLVPCDLYGKGILFHCCIFNQKISLMSTLKGHLSQESS